MRLVAALVLSAAFTVPLLAPAPAQAGLIGEPPPTTCPEMENIIGPITILALQAIYQGQPGGNGVIRPASAADVNHNGQVCVVPHGQRGGRFVDDIPLLVGE